MARSRRHAAVGAHARAHEISCGAQEAVDLFVQQAVGGELTFKPLTSSPTVTRQRKDDETGSARYRAPLEQYSNTHARRAVTTGWSKRAVCGCRRS